ncbi:MAG: methyltransferase [Pseudomonadota bacterium]
MTSISASDLSEDVFLGGRVRAFQPLKGYRAGIDAVLLAAACPAKPGESVLELGCGAGVAALCLKARVTGAQVTGVERQPDYASLAARNGLDVIEADIAALPPALRQRQFHHVIANPPYFNAGSGQVSPDERRGFARHEATPLAAWIHAADKRLRPKGTLTLIHRAERLPDLLAAFGPSLGSIEILPLQARKSRAPRLILLRAKKDGHRPFRLHAPLTLHEGADHGGDYPDYTPRIDAVLRGAQAISFPD